MPHSDEFVEFLLEQMQHSGIDGTLLHAKRMFGGYGVYFDETMFALVADDTLYYKVAENNIADFESHGLEPFSYQRNGKRFAMSYCEAPGDIYEDSDTMRYWSNKAIDASRLAKKQTARKKSSKKKATANNGKH